MVLKNSTDSTEANSSDVTVSFHAKHPIKSQTDRRHTHTHEVKALQILVVLARAIVSGLSSRLLSASAVINQLHTAGPVTFKHSYKFIITLPI